MKCIFLADNSAVLVKNISDCHTTMSYSLYELQSATTGI